MKDGIAETSPPNDPMRMGVFFFLLPPLRRPKSTCLFCCLGHRLSVCAQNSRAGSRAARIVWRKVADPRHASPQCDGGSWLGGRTVFTLVIRAEERGGSNLGKVDASSPQSPRNTPTRSCHLAVVMMGHCGMQQKKLTSEPETMDTKEPTWSMQLKLSVSESVSSGSRSVIKQGGHHGGSTLINTLPLMSCMIQEGLAAWRACLCSMRRRPCVCVFSHTPSSKAAHCPCLVKRL